MLSENDSQNMERIALSSLLDTYFQCTTDTLVLSRVFPELILYIIHLSPASEIPPSKLHPSW